MTRRPSLVHNAYGLWLRLYPGTLRRRHGGEMEHVFEEMLHARPTRTARAWFVVRAFADVARSAPEALRFERRRARRAKYGTTRRPQMSLFSTWNHDLRVATRLLFKQPVFTLVAAGTLALGIGANTAIFSVVYGVLMRPLGIEDASSLTLVQLYRKGAPGDVSGFFPDYLDDFRRAEEGRGTVKRMTSFMYDSVTLTSGRDVFEIDNTVAVDGHFFDVMGVPPLMGRLLSEDDVVPNRRGDVCVISETMWNSQFGSDPDIIGKQLVIDDAPVSVVGVVPAFVPLPIANSRMWLPHGWDAEDPTLRGRLGVFLRLSDPEALDVARATVAESARVLGEKYARFADYTMDLQPFEESLVGSVRPAILITAVAVGLILLIACANTANMALSRAAMRGSEVATRAALGARASQLASQLMAESLALAALGGTLGIGLAFALHRVLLGIAPSYMPRMADVRLDLPVLLFAALTSVVTGVLFGFAPLAHLAGKRAYAPSRSLSVRAASGRSFVADALVVCQVGLSVVLLVGAALMVRSLNELRSQELGFEPGGVAAARIYLDNDAYEEDAQQLQYFNEFLDRLAARPEIDRVGASSGLPLDPFTIDYDLPYQIPGYEERPGEVRQAYFRTITPTYLETIGIQLKAGRSFDEGDRVDTRAVALINENFANIGWPGVNPVGQSFSIYNGSQTLHVVGVVRDVHFRSPASVPKPEFFVPLAQTTYGAMTIVARSRDPERAMRAIADVALEVDRRQPVNSVMTLAGLLAGSIATDRFLTLVLVALGSLALAISAAGIYGLLSYWVSRTRREIGVRMAFGAGVDHILGLVVRRGVWLVLLGVGAGAVASLLMSRLLTSFLYEVQATDMVALSSAFFVLALAAAAAIVIPAWRAAHLDPMRSLRVD